MRTTSARWIFAVLAVALVCAGCKPKPTGRRRQPAPLDAGNEPPNAAVTAMLETEGLAGRVVLVQFGAVGCELSDSTLDEMATLARESAIPHLRFLRVDVSGDARAAEAYLTAKNLPFGVVRDGDRAATRAFDVRSTPSFVLVGKFGRVRYRGRFPSGSLDEWVEALAAETTDPGSRVPLFGAAELDAAKLLVSTRLPELDEPVAALSDRMSPNGLVIVFVDTACPYAGAAIGDLPAVSATLAVVDVPVVAVNLDDDEEMVREFFADKQTGVPVLFDVTTGTKLRWAIDTVPTVVYVDADAEIRYNGPALWADLGAAIVASIESNREVGFSTPGTGYG